MDLVGYITKVCEETLGYQTKDNQNWFDDNDNNQRSDRQEMSCLYGMSKPLKLPHTRKAKNKRLRVDVQRQIRNIKNQWWIAKAAEIQEFTDNHRTRDFFTATRVIYGPMCRHTASLRPKDDSTLVKDKEGILNLWQEHFFELLNRNSRVEPDTIYRIPQTLIRTELDELPLLEEVRKAIVQMKNKASGSDGILSEIYKHGGEILTHHLHHLLTHHLHHLFQKIWNIEEIPSGFKGCHDRHHL